MDAADLVKHLSNSIDPVLAQQLVTEALEIEETFALRKWKYTELDGGRFAEVSARIVYASDSGNVSLTKSVDDCLRYVDNNQVAHGFPEGQSAIHLSKVIRAIYKLRSQRGAVHVSPTYTANEIDSRLILECVRWTFAELLRIFGTFQREELGEIVRSLARFPQPLIRMYGETALLQSTSFTTEEEILAHLLFKDGGMILREILSSVPKDPSGIRRAVAKLASAQCRQIVQRDQSYLITDLGIKRIEEKILKETQAR
jgi:hypothetical protein